MKGKKMVDDSAGSNQEKAEPQLWGATNEPAPPQPTIACLVADLFFVPRLVDVINQLGGVPLVVETPIALVEAVDRAFPVLVLVDLATPGDWEGAIARIKHRPHSRQTPIYAYGAHVEPEILQRARRAGADHAWARSRMMKDLAQVIERHIRPPVRYPNGWDDELSEKAKRGVHEFNQRDYFEQHEWFEEAWMEEQRPIRDMYQGILQVGVAFYLIEEDNWAGALKMFRRGLPRLRDLPGVCQGIDLATFRAQAEAIHAEVVALGSERMEAFDRSLFPRLHVVEDWPPGA
jgi:predicted metal-dependent hydrolase/CheY-like chemotaxis protein